MDKEQDFDPTMSSGIALCNSKCKFWKSDRCKYNKYVICEYCIAWYESRIKMQDERILQCEQSFNELFKRCDHEMKIRDKRIEILISIVEKLDKKF